MTARTQMKKTGAKAASGAAEILRAANKAAAETVSERLNDKAQRTQAEAVDFIGSIRNAVKAATNQLRIDGHATAANLIENATDNINRLEHRVDDFNTARVSNSVQEFIRQKPMVAFGGIALAGFLAAAAMQAARDESKQ